MDYWVDKKMGRENFVTGSDRFDGEWLFGTYLMTAIGYCQQVLQFPELKTSYLPKIHESLLEIRTEAVQKFDIEAWGESPFAFKRSDHVAFLGYYNLALSLYHLIQKNEPKDDLIKLNATITNYLIKRYKISPTKLLLSYPKEVYSVDNCAAIASIAVYDNATGKAPNPIIQDWIKVCKKLCMDPKTGTLIQSLDWQDSIMVDYPRASGTFLGVYFLSFADFEFARELYENSKNEFFENALGFGFVREYTQENPSGKGDIDSGPIIFGYSLSPMGFMLGLSRIFEDRDTFDAIFATCFAGGAPIEKNERFNWATGGPIGDGVIFGMLTCLKKSDWDKVK
ncbi:MAG: hypothetical protein MK132_19865 [Lentisphaerales bacterium]|nr:hypothetical protein [Lentisphaerales bacterium]